MRDQNTLQEMDDRRADWTETWSAYGGIMAMVLGGIVAPAVFNGQEVTITFQRDWWTFGFIVANVAFILVVRYRVAPKSRSRW